MKSKGYLVCLLCAAALFAESACGSVRAQSGTGTNCETSASGILPESSQASAQPSGTSSGTPESAESVPAGKSGSSAASVVSEWDVPSQQIVWDQIASKLSAKIPLMLPTGIPVTPNRHLTAVVNSQTDSYHVNLYETDSAAAVNSPEAAQGTLLVSLNGRKYPNDTEAGESISDYTQVKTADYDEFADLGHGIQAAEQAGTGHQQLLWNEGRWYLNLDFPIDPAYQNKNHPDGKQLAKDIVAYLDKSMLPAPQKVGVIRVKDWNTSAETTVEWQNGSMAYQIVGSEPMTVLKTAVAMRLR